MPVSEWFDGQIQGGTSMSFFDASQPAFRYVDIQARPIVGNFPGGPPNLRVTDLSFQVNDNGSLTYFWTLHNDSSSTTRFRFRMFFEDY
jgi:hypothetical protein